MPSFSSAIWSSYSVPPASAANSSPGRCESAWRTNQPGSRASCAPSALPSAAAWAITSATSAASFGETAWISSRASIPAIGISPLPTSVCAVSGSSRIRWRAVTRRLCQPSTVAAPSTRVAVGEHLLDRARLLQRRERLAQHVLGALVAAGALGCVADHRGDRGPAELAGGREPVLAGDQREPLAVERATAIGTIRPRTAIEPASAADVLGVELAHVAARLDLSSAISSARRAVVGVDTEGPPS